MCIIMILHIHTVIINGKNSGSRMTLLSPVISDTEEYALTQRITLERLVLKKNYQLCWNITDSFLVMCFVS